MILDCGFWIGGNNNEQISLDRFLFQKQSKIETLH